MNGWIWADISRLFRNLEIDKDFDIFLKPEFVRFENTQNYPNPTYFDWSMALATRQLYFDRNFDFGRKRQLANIIEHSNNSSVNEADTWYDSFGCVPDWAQVIFF